MSKLKVKNICIYIYIHIYNQFNFIIYISRLNIVNKILKLKETLLNKLKALSFRL